MSFKDRMIEYIEGDICVAHDKPHSECHCPRKPFNLLLDIYRCDDCGKDIADEPVHEFENDLVCTDCSKERVLGP